MIPEQVRGWIEERIGEEIVRCFFASTGPDDVNDEDYVRATIVRDWLRSQPGLLEIEPVQGVTIYDDVWTQEDFDKMDPPVPPEPDWSQAPEWAQWACVLPSNERMFSNVEPVEIFGRWSHRYDQLAAVKTWIIPCNLPRGIDWRETLRKRPEHPRGWATEEFTDTKPRGELD